MLEQLRQIKGREIFVNTINDYIAIHFSYELSQVARNETIEGENNVRKNNSS